MNFRQFVVRNTLRNKHLYLAYFLSTLFSVMVFFTFSVFAFHPALSKGLNSNVQVGMLVAAVIIYGFAFLFVLYSMDIFIQSRKKEFGLLMIQGMSPKQLKKMIFIENLVIGFFATVFGSVGGIFFSQFILWVSNQLMHLHLGFYFPVVAFGLTVVSFSILFLAISFFIQFRLPKLQLQQLLKAEDLGKGTIKNSKGKAFLAVFLIAIGYTVALIVPGTMILLVMIPVIFLVILGTRFLFNQLSVSIIEGLKKKKKIFWKKTNMVVFSDLAFRMKDNARSFFLVSVISTVAFAAIGTLYGFQSLIMKSTNQIPYEFQLEGKEAEISQTKQAFNKLLNDKGIQVKKAEIAVYTDQNQVRFYKESEYNQLAKVAKEPELRLNNGQGIQLTAKNTFGAPSEQLVKIELPNNEFMSIEKAEKTQVIPAYGTTILVPDSVDTSALESEKLVVWQPLNADFNQLVHLGKTQKEDFNFTSKTYMQQMIRDSYAPILFVGIFIGIVFFVSAGSFLYFRLYSDMNVDVEKFRMIFKIGLTKKELKKMIYQQVGILFFTPIVVSVLHGAIALTAMYHVFEKGMQLEGWQVLGTFVLIQIGYYLIARVVYFKKVYKLVQV